VEYGETDEYDVRGAFNNNQICAKCPSPLEHFVHYKNFLLIKNYILLQVTNCSETSKCSFTGTIQNGNIKTKIITIYA